MDVRAAVATKAGAPLTIETVQLDGPRAGEVLVEIKATGRLPHRLCLPCPATTPKACSPPSWAMKAQASCVEVGAGVTTLKPGDHVIPLYTPECRQMRILPVAQDQSMPGHPRNTGPGRHAGRHQPLQDGRQEVLHYMGTSTFSNYTVVPEIALAKIREDAPFDKVCYIGCGVTTGIGAVINTAKVEPGANVVVFGLGGIGLNVIQGARMAGADKISRRRHQPGPRSAGAQVRHDPLRQPRRSRRRSGAVSGATSPKAAPITPSNASATSS